MAIRTNESTVTFQNSFVLQGFGDELPAGTYRIEVDEEVLEGISFLSYRSVKVVIWIPTKSKSARMVVVDPKEFTAVLAHDKGLRPLLIASEPS